MSSYLLTDVSVRRCEPLVKKYHYSRRMPSAVQLCYGVSSGTELVACCIFSNATGRWETDMWELTRLVRTPDLRYQLSALISKALGHIRHAGLTDLIVSFADSEEDHHGGIYQACSWMYSGRRDERLDGFNVDGKFLPARTANAVHGTSSAKKLVDKLKSSGKAGHVVPHVDTGKHCYWKALTKDGMKKALAVGLRSLPYPKPMLTDDKAENVTKVAGHIGKGVVQLNGQTDKKKTGPDKDVLSMLKSKGAVNK